ncbi:DUF726-domain-containing protein [Aulographum hederae CBS 113979]|uniref:DUF726-domain-containing protein n=1 Tax=Aulographum hederae CBS 113979 TaxID=1176131 RepID=A0A6G1HGC3_9PEZI|nr:DUF726-domain-containing protein [Aulographum hederae CBS 113979]
MPDNDAASNSAPANPPAPAAASNLQDPKNGETSDVSAALPAVDEFGLPIRKARRRVEIEEPSDSESDAQETVAEVEEVENQDPSAHKDSTLESKEAPEAPFDKEKGPEKPPEDKEEAQETHRWNGLHDIADTKAGTTHERTKSQSSKPAPDRSQDDPSPRQGARKSVIGASEWSHQQVAPQTEGREGENSDDEELGWQEMPAYAPFDIYNDDNKLVAREKGESDDEEKLTYGTLGGAGKGYTRVQFDEDAQSATSMDDNTAYLFKDQTAGTHLADEDDEDERDVLSQMQTTKGLLTENQRIAYVGIVRLAMVVMLKELEKLERTRGTRKELDIATEAMKMWSQKTILRLYAHMDIDPAEQMMMEQLSEHGLEPKDLTPALMQNARVKNPAVDGPDSGTASSRASVTSPRPDLELPAEQSKSISPNSESTESLDQPPPYQEKIGDDLPAVKSPSQLPQTKNIDIDLRWTVLCDLFLVLIADSVYDARSRTLLERVGNFLDVEWLEICRFEKRVTDALEMQEAASKENWNEDEHMENRKKMARNRRLMMMGLATVGGGLVIGLSAGLLAPVIGAGLAAGFTTIGVAGTSGFLAGAGGAAVITTTGIVSGGTIAVRAADKRTGAVKTFEYRPLHNNKRVNLIVTVSGWMTGKIDDVRLPFSTVDPIMGDIYSVFWEPEMLQSMGQTINILATEALTQSVQTVLGNTILVALMASLQAPILLTKLSYLIDNPWTNSMARAEAAGLIFADSLIDRNLGIRPITLVGFSLGSRLIFSCLKELARKGAYGLVQNVYLFGSPIVASKDEYLRARSIVTGRFVNGYATNDWILGYLFRATSGGIMRVAGLASVDIPGIENHNVTELVKGHMAYRAAMPRLLREVGWAVESDEFTEIEDPDPENHEKRQRELINEIEEARKELEKQPEKKKWGIFRRKKMAEKKEWETYEEKNRAASMDGKPRSSGEGGDDKVLFDIDAIAREVAELSAQGVEVKEIQSTLPPMQLDLNSSLSAPASSANSNPYSSLRATKSYNDGGSPGASHTPKTNGSTSSLPISPPSSHTNYRAASPLQAVQNSYEYDEYDDYGARSSHDDQNISMTFDTGYQASPALSAHRPQPSPSPALSAAALASPNLSRTPWASSSQQEREFTKSPALRPAAAPAAGRSSFGSVGNDMGSGRGSLNLEHNAWADEEEEWGKEREMQMTFE